MNPADWENWFTNVKKVSFLVENFINLFPCDNNNNNEQFLDKYGEFKSLWQKVTLLKFFIEHLCHLDKLLYLRCITLWNSFDKSIELKNFKYFEKLLKFLKNISTMMEKKYTLVCKGCNMSKTQQKFNKTACPKECLICEDCTQEIVSRNRCPVCSKQASSIKLSPINSDQLKQFKTSMNCFFMDLVSNLCFENVNNLPEKEVIDAIIESLLPKPQVKANTEELLFLDFNINKSIKSTLFQLLLNYNKKDVELHLNKILSKSNEYLKQHYNSDDLIDLKLMYVNSIEDNFYSKGTFDKSVLNVDLDAKLGNSFLKDLVNETMSCTDKDVKTINELKMVAQIKFSLVTLAKLFAEHPEDREYNQIGLEFIKTAEDFIQNSLSMWPRFFLIKYIYRRYGPNILMSSLKNELFNWIIPEEMVKSDEVCFLNDF